MSDDIDEIFEGIYNCGDGFIEALFCAEGGLDLSEHVFDGW